MTIAEESERQNRLCAAGPDHRLWPSHHATDNLAIFRDMPNLTIIDSCDALEINQVIPAITPHQGPV